MLVSSALSIHCLEHVRPPFVSPAISANTSARLCHRYRKKSDSRPRATHRSFYSHKGCTTSSNHRTTYVNTTRCPTEDSRALETGVLGHGRLEEISAPRCRRRIGCVRGDWMRVS